MQNTPPPQTNQLKIPQKFYYIEYMSKFTSAWAFSSVHVSVCSLCLLTYFCTVKFLEVIKPFCVILPEIQKPERKVG